MIEMLRISESVRIEELPPAAFPLSECKAKYKMFFGVQRLSPPLNYFAPSTGGAYPALVTTELRVNF